MKSAPGWKEIGLVAAVVIFNAAALTQLVSGTGGQLPTAFAQPYNDGLPCIDNADCISGNCVDDVCCNTVCNLPGQTCDMEGSVGTCLGTAPAPVLAFPIQWFAAGLVAFVALFRLRRRFR
jgi:hypothetical protein